MTLRSMHGLRIVDLTHVWAGPIAARFFADLGADVIKVERPDTIESARTLYPAGNSTASDYWERSPNFQERNAGKRSAVIDLKAPEGRTAFERLLERADVLFENFRPGVMRSLGLDFQSLHERYPHLVMISIGGHGQTGPKATLPMTGIGMEPASGISSVTGYADGPPMLTCNTWIDPLTAMHAAAALLIALVHREQTGQGQHIDLSMQETTLQLMGGHLMDYAVNGRLAGRSGNRTLDAIRGSYRCLGDDEWVAVAIRDDREWRAFCEVVGHVEWADAPEFRDHAARRAAHDEIDRRISAWTAKRSKYEVMTTLQQAGVPAGAHLKADELQTNEQLVARDFFDPLAIPDFGVAPIHRGFTPWIDGAGFPPRAPGPRLGEHTDEVLREAGLSEAELAALHERRVIDPHLEGLHQELARRVFRLPTEQLIELGLLRGVDADYLERSQQAFRAGRDRAPHQLDSEVPASADR